MCLCSRWPGVGQIGLPFSESGAINILGFLLPAGGRLDHHRQRNTGVSLGGSLNVKWWRLPPAGARPPARAMR